MSKQAADFAGRPLLDIVSYGRRGPQGRNGRFSADEIAQIRRTAQRVPEVMVKVLPRGSHDLASARRHLDYISRNGKLALETDESAGNAGLETGALLADWDLEIDSLRRQSELTAAGGRASAKLVHKLMFSMPPGTPPAKVADAVRAFAREEFAFKHRYAFVLHTDEPHPHVHLVLKATSEEGIRLNITKATLRFWRSEFASKLRMVGVAANATERAVRWQHRKPLKDGIYRSGVRGDSTFLQSRTIVAATTNGNDRSTNENPKLLQTQAKVFQGWAYVAGSLARSGRREVADDIARYLSQWRTPEQNSADCQTAHAPTHRSSPQN